MVIGLKDELASEFHAVPFLVHLVDQHCVEVFVLERRTWIKEKGQILKIRKAKSNQAGVVMT